MLMPHAHSIHWLAVCVRSSRYGRSDAASTARRLTCGRDGVVTDGVGELRLTHEFTINRTSERHISRSQKDATYQRTAQYGHGPPRELRETECHHRTSMGGVHVHVHVHVESNASRRSPRAPTPGVATYSTCVVGALAWRTWRAGAERAGPLLRAHVTPAAAARQQQV